MNIHEKVNHNYKNSTFVMLFENLRTNRHRERVYDSVQFHRIKNTLIERVCDSMSRRGFTCLINT